MKRTLKIGLYILFYVATILLLVLSFSMLVDSINSMRSQYVAGHFDMNWWNFIKYVFKSPINFKYYGKIFLVCLSNVVILFGLIAFTTYRISPKAKQKIGDLKEKCTLYQRKKLERKKEKIAEKINKFNNQENE